MKRPVIEGQFVNFLLTQGDPEAVTEAASHLLQTGNQEGTETLAGSLRLAPRTQASRSGLSAVEWLGDTDILPSLGADSPVTNGDFGKSPTSHGFDWHLPTVEGVSSFLNANPNTLGFEFSGEEPDSFLLLSQTAPVHAQKNYALTVDYGTSGIPPGSGIEWQVTDERTGAVLARTPSLSSKQGGEQGGEQGGKVTTCFTTPARAAFVNLSLLYQRQPGTVRVGGKACPESSEALRRDCRRLRGPRKSPIPGLIPRHCETTLKKPATGGLSIVYPARRTER